MTVALGPIQLTVNIVRTSLTPPAAPTLAERVQQRNARSRAVEASRVRWLSELNRWV